MLNITYKYDVDYWLPTKKYQQYLYFFQKNITKSLEKVLQDILIDTSLGISIKATINN